MRDDSCSEMVVTWDDRGELDGDRRYVRRRTKFESGVGEVPRPHSETLRALTAFLILVEQIQPGEVPIGAQ